MSNLLCKGLLARDSAVVEYDPLAGRVGISITRIAISRKQKQLATWDFTGIWKSSRATSGSDRVWVRPRPLPVLESLCISSHSLSDSTSIISRTLATGTFKLSRLVEPVGPHFGSFHHSSARPSFRELRVSKIGNSDSALMFDPGYSHPIACCGAAFYLVWNIWWGRIFQISIPDM